MSRRAWRILIVVCIALTLALSLTTLFLGPWSRPQAPAEPAVQIGDAARWVNGHRCPDAADPPGCKLLFGGGG